MEQLASITILTNDRQSVSESLNRLLTSKGHLIMARMGVNVQKSCTEHCPGLIVLVIKDKKVKIDQFIDELNSINGLEVKSCFFEEN